MVKVKYIAVPQSIEGLENIFGGWLVRLPCPTAPTGEFVALVDVGTATAAPAFIAALKQEGVERIDLVLISHIHVDHAGALADVLAAYPTARAVCHSRGLAHLANPERLWESTRTVMSVLADMYGRPKPVPPERLVGLSPDEFSTLPPEILPFGFPEIGVMAVPGHSPHSMFYSLGDYYFIGEAASCTFEFQNQVFFRAATPARFELPVFVRSINKLLTLPERPAFAGHSPRPYPSHWLLTRSREQLYRWLDLLAPVALPEPGENQEVHLEHLLELIIREDPDFGPIGVWAAPKWDRFFHKNSIFGFVDYLRRAEREVVQI